MTGTNRVSVYMIIATLISALVVGIVGGCAGTSEKGNRDAVAYYEKMRNDKMRVGQLVGAEIAGEKAVIAAERAYGAGDLMVADQLMKLGAIYATDGRYKRAEHCYRRGLDVREDMLGSNHLDVAATMMSVGEFYVGAGMYEEAEPMYIRAIAIREYKLGVEDPKVAESRCAMAAMYFRMGMYDEAETEANQAIEICENAMEQGRLDVIGSIGYLMKLFQQMDNRDKVNLVGKLMRRMN